MLFSASGTSPQQPPQGLQNNNQNNNGLIGDGSYNIITSGNNQFNITQIAPAEGEDDELDKSLHGYVTKDALHNSFYSPPECYPNTRTTVLNEISGWIDEGESEKSPLLWLNGPAAVGKSVIAKTISSFYDPVVATFFFSTSSDRSAATLFPTLAWQLARRIPDTRQHIIASLKNSGSLQTTQIEEQFDLLILQPLKSTTTLKPRPVMVIDGVDECIDESMLVRFLRVLVRAGECGGMPVRFMICSRSEPRIRGILGRVHDVNPTVNGKEPQLPSRLHRVLYLFLLFEPSQGYQSTSEPHLHTPTQWSGGFTELLKDTWKLYQLIRLGVDKDAPPPSDTSDGHADTLDKICSHPVVSTIKIGFSEECKQDIARYLTDTFNAIPQSGDGSGTQIQPCDISYLVEASCGQFLYASTLVRLLDEPHFDPRDVFEMARRGSLPTPDLNRLYESILKRAQNTIRTQAQEGGPDYQTEWRFLMDSLAILVFFAGNAHFSKVPKSYPVIESLLGLEEGKLSKKLGKMHSVLRIVPGESVQVHHRSFLEFLQSRARSGDYYISNSTALWRSLILFGRAGLRYNIFQNNDNRWCYIHDMREACQRNFFERSRFPNVLDVLHFFIHSVMMYFLALLFSRMMFALPVPPICWVSMLFFLSFFGTFILSLMTYTFFFNRSIIIPFFHPFLHPLFDITGGVPSRLIPYIVVCALLADGLIRALL